MNDKIDLKPIHLKEIPSTLRDRSRRELDERAPLGDEIRKARASHYFVWYKCLKLSDEYQHCCHNKGRGRLKPLYDDFGDVTDMSFEMWWQRIGRYLFNERKPLPKVIEHRGLGELAQINNMRDKVVLEVPLNIRRPTALRQISKILAKAYEGREEVVPRNKSTARRKLSKSRLRIGTLHKMLRVYETRIKNPHLQLWQVGERAGIELDLQARTTDEVMLTLQEERRRMAIAVGRYLGQARNLIWNATEGVYPSIAKPFVTEDSSEQ
jgi:hypothetical protein